MQAILDKIEELKAIIAQHGHELKQIRIDSANFYIEYKGIKVFGTMEHLREVEDYLNG